jgi:O-antigen ligase
VENPVVSQYIKKYSDLFIPLLLCLCILGFALPLDWRIPLAILVIAGMATTLLDRPVHIRQSYSPLLLPLGIYLSVTGLTTAYSVDTQHSLQLSATLIPTIFLGYLISINFTQNNTRQLLFINCTLLSLLLSISLLWMAWQHPDGHPSAWVERFGSTLLLGHNDTVVLALLAPFALALIWIQPRSLIAMFAMITLVLSTAVIVIYQSRGALLTLILAAGLMTLLLNRRIALWLIAGLLSSVIVVDANLGWPLISKFATFGQVIDSRLRLWLAAWLIFLDHPILGTGPHTYGLVYQGYFQNLALPDWVGIDHRHSPWAHNLYLETLAEQGLFGALALGFLLWQGFIAILSVPNHELDRISIILRTALLIGLSCFIFCALFEATFKRAWALLILAILLGSSSFATPQTGDNNEIKKHTQKTN